MYLFFVAVAVSSLVVCSVMGFLGLLARQVPDESERVAPTRLNPDQIRLLAYVAVAAILLLSSMYELHLMYAE